MEYKWKQYGAAITIGNGDNDPIWSMIQKRKIECEECLQHYAHYQLFSKPYRKYRRGKNRCRRCGLKL